MTYVVRIEQHASQSLAVVRRHTSTRELAKVVPEACGLVWGVVRSHAVAGAGRLVALYRDCRDGRVNLEVGVEVAGPFAGAGEVVASATPAGPVATATHYGPYGRLGEAHEAIRSWCDEKGHGLAGPNWEVYGHWEDEWNRDPSRIRTDLVYLLAAGDEPAVKGPSKGLRE